VLQTPDLRNNSITPVTVAGDNLVLFRDAAGRARALENRCPHRGALLSLGQASVVTPGTLTCRYHGMTFDGDGNCTAYVTDGPDSPACGKIRARAYPVQESAGIIWAYMGAKTPRPVQEAVPHARTVLTQPHLMIFRFVFPFSYLNQIDNATDLAHVAVLHRNCILFSDQKSWGSIEARDLPGEGVHAYFAEPGGHPGPRNNDKITFYLPGFVYHAPGELGFTGSAAYFWFVPRDIGSFEGWLILGAPRGRRNAAVRALMRHSFGTPLMRNVLGADCIYGGDGPMQLGQGRIVRWDTERLTRTDRGVSKTRRLLQQAHIRELAERTQSAARRAQPAAR
jgi:phenylpropionate dioxygenase-like ring-hydroxylating dioxygenase large terminal subunit